jgi:hypothetical protein
LRSCFLNRSSNCAKVKEIQGAGRKQQAHKPAKSPLERQIEQPAQSFRIRLSGITVVPGAELDEAKVAELAKDLKAHGLKTPLIVRPKEGAAGFWLVEGRYRLAAARRLKLPSVPCVVQDEAKPTPTEIEPGDIGAEFLLRADQAIRMAYADGPVTEEIAATAEKVARAWTKLAAQLRLKAGAS